MNTNKLILCNLVPLEKKKKKEREKKSHVGYTMKNSMWHIYVRFLHPVHVF